MNKKAIKDMFSMNMENHDIDESEINELLDLGNALSKKDFSKDSNKEAVYAKTLRNINKHKGDINMKKPNKFKTTIAASVATALILGGPLSQTAFGKEIVNKIIATFSLNHIKVTQTEPINGEIDVPNQFKGKIFDKNGNELTKVSEKDQDNLYTSDGKKIYSVTNSEIITYEEHEKQEKEMKDSTLTVKDTTKLNDYTCFNVKLPKYLPEGYKFDKAEFYKDENGKVEKTKYIDLYFVNEKGKTLFMQQRFADKETAYETGTDGTVEKLKINGVDAILMDNKNIHFEANNTLYIISTKGNISKEELIKMAESI